MQVLSDFGAALHWRELSKEHIVTTVAVDTGLKYLAGDLNES